MEEQNGNESIVEPAPSQLSELVIVEGESNGNDGNFLNENEKQENRMESYEVVDISLKKLMMEPNALVLAEEKNKEKNLIDTDCMNNHETIEDSIHTVCENVHEISKDIIPTECENVHEISKDIIPIECDNTDEITTNLISTECENVHGISKDFEVEKTGHETAKDLIHTEAENGQEAAKELIHNVHENRNATAMELMCKKCKNQTENVLNTEDEIKNGSLAYSKEESGKQITTPTQNYTKEDIFEIPNDSLAEKIVCQAEFYFSDFNVLKNNFLLKHIRRNKEGYVSLKLVASFRKIKSLTKDWRVVAYSLEGSELLEMNAEKTKIRRIKTIPKFQDTSFGKTVIAFNLPFKNPTSEELKELFSKFGSIASAEIMTPKSDTYNTYHKRCRFHHQEISSAVFGAVEFEKYEDALAALKDEDGNLPKENKMKVVPLMPKVFETNSRNSKYNRPLAPYHQRGGRGFKPKPEFHKSQMGNVMVGEYVTKGRPPNGEIFYRNQYRQRIPLNSHSASDMGGKMAMEHYAGNCNDGRKSVLLQRQLKMNNTMNVNSTNNFSRPQPGPNVRFQGTHADE